MDAESTYIGAILEFADAMERYALTKDGAYVMQAWNAWRTSNDLRAEYESSLLERTLGSVVSCEGADDREARLFAAMDEVAGQHAVPKSRSHQVIRAMNVVETMNISLFNAQELVKRWRSGATEHREAPPVTETHLVNIAASEHGISVSAVRKIWDGYLAKRGHSNEYRKLISDLKESTEVAKKPPAKTNRQHPFKR
jgi:hypothetical protein